MRESDEKNNLFYLCSLTEYISRKTKNKKVDIIKKIGFSGLKKIYDFSDIYHSENIEKISDEIINEYKIEDGCYNILNVNKRIPSYFEIGRVYQRLILMVDNNEEKYIDNFIKVMSSFIIEHIDNYESSMYYENPSYIYECFKAGKIL